MSMPRIFMVGFVLALTVAGCSRNDDGSSTRGITQADVDRMLANKKPGACLTQNVKEPVGKTQDGRTFLRAGCRQRIPEGSTLEYCREVKKQLSPDYRVTFYADKHCSDLQLSGKDISGSRTVTGYAEAEGGVIVDSSDAGQTPAELPQAAQSTGQKQADGGIVVE